MIIKLKNHVKVLFISSGYPSKNRPNQNIFTHRSIYHLAKELDTKVIHFKTWVPGRKIIERREWEGIDIITLACPQIPGGSDFHINSILLYLFGGLFINEELQNADIVHSTDFYPSGYVASNWAKKFKKTHTSHIIGSDLNLFLIPKLERVRTDWIQRIKGIICNSFDLSNKIKGYFPDQKNIEVIYRGVDCNVFNPIGEMKGPQKELPPVRFLYLGGFHTWDSKKTGYFNLKGGHILLDTWEKIEKYIQPSNLLISGPGVNLEKLEIWRKKLSYPDSVHFLKVIKPEDVPSIIRASDVVIIPSLSEGLPNVAKEAQACGKPVLGSDAGGIPESIIHKKTGYIVPKGSIDELAKGIEWFFCNQDEIKIMGLRGRERMKTDFSWDLFTHKMLDFFDKVNRNKIE